MAHVPHLNQLNMNNNNNKLEDKSTYILKSQLRKRQRIKAREKKF